VSQDRLVTFEDSPRFLGWAGKCRRLGEVPSSAKGGLQTKKRLDTVPSTEAKYCVGEIIRPSGHSITWRSSWTPSHFERVSPLWAVSPAVPPKYVLLCILDTHHKNLLRRKSAPRVMSPPFPYEITYPTDPPYPSLTGCHRYLQSWSGSFSPPFQGMPDTSCHPAEDPFSCFLRMRRPPYDRLNLPEMENEEKKPRPERSRKEAFA